METRSDKSWHMHTVTGAGSVIAFRAQRYGLWMLECGSAEVTIGKARFCLSHGQYLLVGRSEAGEIRLTGAAPRVAGVVAPAALVERLCAKHPDSALSVVLDVGRIDSLLDAEAGTAWADAQCELARGPRSDANALKVRAPRAVDALRALLRALLSRQADWNQFAARLPGRTLAQQRQLVSRLVRSRLAVTHGPERDYAITELAGIASLSVHHYVRIFGRVFGETPHRFMTGERLQRAAALLVADDTSIAAIAERLGFRNRRWFTRLFHRHFGRSATAHRLRAREQRRAELAWRHGLARDDIAGPVADGA